MYMLVCEGAHICEEACAPTFRYAALQPCANSTPMRNNACSVFYLCARATVSHSWDMPTRWHIYRLITETVAPVRPVLSTPSAHM